MYNVDVDPLRCNRAEPFEIVEHPMSVGAAKVAQIEIAYPGMLVDLTITSARVFRATDSNDSRFYIQGILLEGVLTFEVVAELIQGQRGNFSGRKFFEAMLTYFDLDNIQKIKAIWVDSPGIDTNLRLFNRWTGTGGLQGPDAARKTKTGEYAIAYQFLDVRIIMAIPPIPGQYEDVIVEFSK